MVERKGSKEQDRAPAPLAEEGVIVVVGWVMSFFLLK
jgi:hypothetical protein